MAINLGGGYHHAARDQGMGFCIFNDIAVAVARHPEAVPPVAGSYLGPSGQPPALSVAVRVNALAP